MRTQPLCIVRTSESSFQLFGAHDPVMGDDIDGPVTMHITFKTQQLSICFCKRCGLAYLNKQETTFGEVGPTSVHSPHGGSA